MLGVDTHELAWAAGFFDGEGCASLARSTGWSKMLGRERVYLRPWLTIGQTDRWVLDRFHQAVGVGRVTGPHVHDARNPRAREQWRYESTSFADSVAVIALLWRWLSPVKREQAARVFRAVKQAREPRVQEQVRWASRGRNVGRAMPVVS